MINDAARQSVAHPDLSTEGDGNSVTDGTEMSHPVTLDRPMKLQPRLDPKPWGGRRLEQLGKTLPEGPVGESIETDPATRIVDPVLDGMTLGDLARAAPVPLLGERGVAASGALHDFPLLAKLIDAVQPLSVQVHPDDARAPAGRRGKTEAWLILDADPGAEIVTGVRGPVNIDSIEQQLVREPIRPGDVFFVRAGTIHAIGAGVLLYEIQQASDVTWRLYDWGSDRELHIAQALSGYDAVSRARRVTPVRLNDRSEIIVASRYFAVERRVVDGPERFPSMPGSFRILTVLDGRVRLGDVTLGTGDSAVVPAAMPESPIDGNGIVLIAWIPDLDAEIVGPLRVAGHMDSAIRQLGEDLL